MTPSNIGGIKEGHLCFLVGRTCSVFDRFTPSQLRYARLDKATRTPCIRYEIVGRNFPEFHSTTSPTLYPFCSKPMSILMLTISQSNGNRTMPCGTPLVTDLLTDVSAMREFMILLLSMVSMPLMRSWGTLNLKRELRLGSIVTLLKAPSISRKASKVNRESFIFS